MYRLNNKVQNYDWGKLGSQSKAATLCNQGTLEINEETPYAELWMGTHPNAPSLLITKQPLQEIINSDTCSKAVFDRYQDLPFLFKVLSIRKVSFLFTRH
jgi:mannose-6-phosphate isomerase